MSFISGYEPIYRLKYGVKPELDLLFSLELRRSNVQFDIRVISSFNWELGY
jgi:hypothetical protein